MFGERDDVSIDLQKLEAQLDEDRCDLPDISGYVQQPTVPAAYAMAADYLGLSTPGHPSGPMQNDKISLHAVEALRQMIDPSRSGRGSSQVTDWRSTPSRPRSARYMRPRCRLTPEGAGGAPLQRPTSAPAGRAPPKTERWRESGLTRWPKESDKTNHSSDPSDGDPLRRGVPEQPGWQGELWIRSLRRPGLEIQDPAYHDVAQRGMRELHEEWQAPRRPMSARMGRARPTVPYGGKTTTGQVALPRQNKPKAWVERPVATGKMALSHLNGQRYTFSQEPRPLEWEDYLRTINQART